jgi:signal transduction histidine kinase/ActR/RegA family two-component response regulator
MTLPASIALLSAGIACFVAAMSAQFARAPGWRDQRYFTYAALAVAAYTTLNLPTNAHVLGDEAVVICSRLQIAAAALHMWCWLRITSVVSGRAASSRLDRALGVGLGVLAAIGVATPLFVHGSVHQHSVLGLDATYRTPYVTEAGSIAWGLILALLLVPLTRLARAWRLRVPGAAVQFVALALLLAFGVNDALIVSRVYQGPYLVDLGFLLPLAAVSYSFTSRFVGDARALATLRGELERQVTERTTQLGHAQAALHRAEKLAALGQFAAGVAHEVNNPSAVVSASLQYLSEAEADALSESGREAIDEALRSVQRISAIVRQLLDAGRLAASSEPTQGVALVPLGDSALRVARARLGKRVALANHLPAGIHVAAQESVLVQVLVNLVVNAVQAVPEARADGRVNLQAELDGSRVRLVVEDNGAGMEPEVLRRVFEPFFTTKPFGCGTGLGLAVSRGLITGLGGDLRLESRPGIGTRAIVELPRAHAPVVTPAPTGGLRALEPKRRLLLVDDEPAVLSSVRRLLEQYFWVEIASGVDDGLLRLESGAAFDLVLCDVMMPAGGGQRLYQTLLGQRPSLARRVVFLTGGAVTDGARRFLREQPQPVLSKPLDMGALARAAEAVTRGEVSSQLH